MGAIMNICTALTVISTLALLGLLYIYIKNLKKIKSKFTMGLLIFAVLFLLQNFVSLYFYFTMMEYFVPQVEIHELVLNSLQTAAFLILLKISWE